MRDRLVAQWFLLLQLFHQHQLANSAQFSVSRQALPTLDRSKYASADGVAKGGYVLADSDDDPRVILIATGSEVSLAVGAYEKLKADGIGHMIDGKIVPSASGETFETASPVDGSPLAVICPHCVRHRWQSRSS